MMLENSQDPLTPGLRLIIDTVPALISYLDSQRRYVFTNAKYREWFGDAYRNIEGKYIWEVIGAGAYESIRQYVDEVLAGNNVTYETTIPYQSGGTREVRAHYIPDYDPAGSIKGFVAMVSDISLPKNTSQILRESAHRLALALSASHLGDWSWDAKTDSVNLSSRAAEILGIRPGSHITRADMLQLVHEQDRERASKEVNDSINHNTAYSIEYRIKRSDGRDAWVLGGGKALYDDQNQVTGMLGVVQDITAQKEIEQALRDETSALQKINEVGVMLAAELDLQQLVQRLTDIATEISGARFGSFFYNTEDEKGGSYMLYTLSGVPRSAFENFPMPRATSLFGPTFRGEEVVRSDDIRKDPRYGKNPPHHGMPAGHLPVVSYLAVPVITRTGHVLGGLFFGHPEPAVFTERVERIIVGLAGQAATAIDNARLFQAVQNAREAAESANRLKDEFLATISHELRTPLTSILGWSRLLSAGKVDETNYKRAISSIEKNAKAQQQLIDSLLDVSRIITGKLRLDVAPMDPASVIEATIDSLRPSIDAKELQLHVQLSSEAVGILGDEHRIQQIVWNLLSNAIKFTPKGGRIEVLLRRADSFMEFVVSDTGKGISKDFLPRVFERFLQADSSYSRSHGGLGLGLAIVRHLVELHGGTVSVHSPGIDGGATFTVRIPLAVVTRMADFQPQQLPGLELPETLPLNNLSSLDGLKVLLIDDEEDTLDILTAILVKANIEVRTASSSSDGLQLLNEWQPDILLSDIGMPHEDGYELIAKLRATPGVRGKIPAVALTAYARTQDRLKALSSGYQAHISKPVDPAELITVIASLTGRAGIS